MTSTDQQIGRAENAISHHSEPTALRITDMRLAVVASNYDYPILKIDTNQGVYGLGEVRDAGHAENALQFKSALLGQNPCNVDMIFRALKRFGNWGREGGGVSGIEIALMDLVGKVYGVPCYQMLGGKHRDKVRLYGDTAVVTGRSTAKGKDQQGAIDEQRRWTRVFVRQDGRWQLVHFQGTLVQKP